MTGRSRLLSLAAIVPALTATIVVCVAMDVLLARNGSTAPLAAIVYVALFNATAVLQALTGGLIEWRRPGQQIGRLLLISGPLYALLAATWTSLEALRPLLDETTYGVLAAVGGSLSWAGVALIAGWLPLLFPTGSLPAPRWRIPALAIAGIGTAGVVAVAVKPGAVGPGTGVRNPFGIEGWSPSLQLLVDAIPIALLALIVLAVAGLITRYRRGDLVERLQVRWLLGAVAIVVAGFIGAVVETSIRPEHAPLLSPIVIPVGVLFMPIAIGIAILRYRLYEIDRIISRTLGYAALTAALALVYGAAFIGLQAILAPITSSGGSLAVAASTLAVFALFQPLRRRFQSAMDRRFNRSRYDAAREIEGFAARVRDEVEVDRLTVELSSTLERTMQPASASIWLRAGAHEGQL